MTLLWCDGFEGQDWTSWYINVTQTGTDTTGSRLGYGRYVAFAGTPGVITRQVTASADIYSGVAYRISTPTAINAVEFYGDSAATLHIAVAVRADGGIDIKRGTTVVASSAVGLIVGTTWNYIEVHAKVNDTTGACEVRLNGDTTPVVTFSGDTKNAGTSTNIDAVLLRGNSGVDVDDLYICNGLGSLRNTFLGDCKVETLQPSGAGASTALTPSAGANYTTVDELPPVSTDYSGSATAGARDTYAMGNLSGTPSVVLGVQLNTFMHKSDAGAASMKPVLRVGSTDYYGSTYSLSTSMQGFSDIWEASPSTSSAWTVSEVNAAESGAEVA